jgi:hypothetical protein
LIILTLVVVYNCPLIGLSPDDLIFSTDFNASVANYVKMEESTYQCNEFINLNQLKNGPEPLNPAAEGNPD